MGIRSPGSSFGFSEAMQMMDKSSMRVNAHRSPAGAMTGSPTSRAPKSETNSNTLEVIVKN